MTMRAASGSQVSVQPVSPLAADNVAVANATGHLLLTPAGTIATLTVTLPNVCSAFANRITIFSSQAITVLTIATGSNTIVGTLSTLALGGFASFVLVGTVWYRCG